MRRHVVRCRSAWGACQVCQAEIAPGCVFVGCLGSRGCAGTGDCRISKVVWCSGYGGILLLLSSGVKSFVLTAEAFESSPVTGSPVCKADITTMIKLIAESTCSQDLLVLFC